MAYCALKWEMLWARPYRHNSHPTRFSLRREATIAPMVEKNTALRVLSSQESKMCVCGWERFRAKSKRANMVRVKESPQSDHASQEAVRVFIPPTPRSSLLFLLSQPHSTAAPSPSRYGKRYEV